jgi:magnesium transporter
MPELHTRHGYYIVWLIMISIAVFMLFYFRRKGWIGKERD